MASTSSESARRRLMLSDQRREVDADRRAVDHPPLAGDHHAVGAVRAAQNQRGERVMGAAEARLGRA